MAIKNILWDFDGVILDSMPIRYQGFELLFANKYPREQVQQLLNYHEKNGGLSRYHKIRYFYEQILGQMITEDEVQELANEFSVLMKRELTNKNLLITETLNFIQENYQKINMHVVSGSDGDELRFLCKELDISQYFLSIHGSPTPKNILVKNLLKEYKYLTNETILIGDSVNDYEAANANGISFYGYRYQGDVGNLSLLKDMGVLKKLIS